MNTVIFKWNPAISSYSMSDFLNSIIETVAMVKRNDAAIMK